MSKNPPKVKPDVIAKFTQMVLNAAMSRSTMPGLFRGQGVELDQGCRNLDKECGYIVGDPSIEEYRLMYDQEGTASRIVGLYADECWGIYPEIYETEDDRKTAFERAWDKLSEDLDPWSYLYRADELSGIGHFGILLLGFDDGQLLSTIAPGINERGEPTDKRPTKPVKLLYMRPFSEDLLRIQQFQTDTSNPRYGQPLYYQIRMTDPRNPASVIVEPASMVDQVVHWSRVLHVADNCKSSEVFGLPRLKNLHRRVFDIRKILGSSGEMFYKGGFPGTVFETDPSLIDLADVDLDSLKTEIQAYSDGLQRYMRLVGMTAKSLLPQVADPGPHLIQQYQYICATIKAPMKVFLGEEAGKVSSEETRLEWNARLATRQRLYLNPRMVRPFIRRLMYVSVLPRTKDDTFIINWKDLNALGESDKAARALQMAQAILQYVTSGSAHLIPPRMFFTLILQMSEDQADAIITAAGGADKIMGNVQQMLDAQAGNTPNSSGTNPTASTGAGGRRNAQGRSAKNKTRSRNGGTAS